MLYRFIRFFFAFSAANLFEIMFCTLRFKWKHTMGEWLWWWCNKKSRRFEWNNDVHYVAEFTLFSEIIPRIRRKRKKKKGEKIINIELISKRNEKKKWKYIVQCIWTHKHKYKHKSGSFVLWITSRKEWKKEKYAHTHYTIMSRVDDKWSHFHIAQEIISVCCFVDGRCHIFHKIWNRFFIFLCWVENSLPRTIDSF